MEAQDGIIVQKQVCSEICFDNLLKSFCLDFCTQPTIKKHKRNYNKRSYWTTELHGHEKCAQYMTQRTQIASKWTEAIWQFSIYLLD